MLVSLVLTKWIAASGNEIAWFGAYLSTAHVHLQKHSFQGSELLFQSCCVPYGTCWCIHTKYVAFTPVYLPSKRKVPKNSLRRKSEHCPGPNEIVDKYTNHEFPDKKVII